jgi:hypothetical protein
MASRREFLQTGVAAASILPIAGTSPAALLQPLSVYKVIFDQRFPSSREFADEARSLGLPVHAIEGDITDVWFHDLSLRWEQEPAAIAGLTAHGPLFCLERLAWDHRMRVVFRAGHRISPDGTMEHALWGPQQMLNEVSSLTVRPDWGKAVADLLPRCPQNAWGSAKRSRVAGPRIAQPHGEPLFSWIIAAKK